MYCKRLSPILLSVFLIFGFVGTASSQDFQSLEKKAIRSYKKGNLVKARDQFQLLYDGQHNLNSTAPYLAKCHIALHDYGKAQEILEQLNEMDDETIYLYAQSNILSEDFNKADSLMALLQDTSSFDTEETQKTISRAQNYYKNSKGYFVQNLGSRINTKDREYNAIMYDNYNELIFTKRAEASEDVDSDGLAYEMIYYTKFDSTNNGQWVNASELNMEGNRADTHDATVQIYRNGTRMISYRDGDLFSHSLVDGVWQRDEDLFIKGINANNTHCFITEDEKTLFFASDFQSEGENLDLFVMQKDSSGVWGEPAPITALNTEFDEDAPFLARNGIFYFSSRGHDSMGGYDIFQTSYDSAAQEWKAPENLGHPINTVAEDTYFSMDGKLGYLSSTRAGGFGSLDVYRVYLFNKVSVAGQLLDSANNPVTDAEVDILYDSIHLKTYTDGNGAYELLVPIYKEMKLTFEKDNRKYHEGEYVAHVFFKDRNDNTFNFYFENNEEAETGAKASSAKVRHINVKVRNDYAENLIIENVPKKEEVAWADSVNAVDSVNYITEYLARNEEVQLIKETVKVASTNFKLNDMVIIKKIEPKNAATEAQENGGEQKRSTNSKLYTVQILAMTMPNEPDQKYFSKLEPRSIVLNVQGKDGLNRFYLGAYESKRDAIKAMRKLRKTGYADAFIRKIKKYEEL